LKTFDLARAMVAIAGCRTVDAVVKLAVSALAATEGTLRVRLWLIEPSAVGGAPGLRLAGSAGTPGRDDVDPDPEQLRSLALDAGASVVPGPRGLSHEGRELGTLLVEGTHSESPRRTELVSIFIDHLAVALANAFDLEQTESERRQLAAENSKLREELLDLFEEAPIAYVHEGIDTRFIRANRAALRMLGVQADDVTTTYGRSLVSDSDETQAQLRQALAAVERGTEARDVVLELRRKDDGKSIWVQWWSKPAPRKDYMRTMMIDITDRIVVERTKAALEFSIESGQVGDWDLDLDRQTSRRSLRHDRCFGYDTPIPEERWGLKDFLAHVHPEDQARTSESLFAALASLGDWASEFRVVWPDASVHWLIARGRVYSSERGRATRMLGIVIDVTERKRAELALRETQAALDFALEAGEIGDWDLDLLRDTSRRSLRHDRCFGYDRPIPESEWGAEVFLRHVHPGDRERMRKTLDDAAAARVAWSAEFRVVWPDGSLHWLAARGSVYRSAEGKATRMLGIVMDISAHKRAEEVLKASERLAHSQVETLQGAVAVLTRGSAPDPLIEHGLRVITEQLDAHSCSIWRYEEASGLMSYEFGFEEGKLVKRGDPRLEGFRTVAPLADMPPMTDVLRAGKIIVREDIRELPVYAGYDRLRMLGIVTVLVVPLRVRSRVDAMLGIRFSHKRSFSDDELELAQALANQTLLAWWLTRLSEQARSAAVVAERNRMARDIHDTLAQGFTGVIVQLEAAADATSRELPAEAARHAERALTLARESLREARRSVRALRPQDIVDRGFAAAVEALVRKMTAGTPVVAAFAIAGKPRTLRAEYEDNLLRVTQEVLTNVLRHSGATRFDARVTYLRDGVSLDLRDNGCGFDRAKPFEGFGLLGMRERVESMQGSLTLRSAPGTGTTVLISVPLQASDPASAS
jgi:PAS domain S-box-containing protein